MRIITNLLILIAVAVCITYLALDSLTQMFSPRYPIVRYQWGSAGEQASEQPELCKENPVTENMTEERERRQNLILHPEKVSKELYDNRTLTVRLIGGLGNQLWLYATVYGLAKKTNRQPIACSSIDLHKIFSNLSTVELHKDGDCLQGSEILNRSAKLVERPSHLTYDVSLPQVLKEPTPQHAFLCCYLQNLGYFVEYMDEIRSQFTLQDALRTHAQDFIRNLLHRVAQNMNKTISQNHKGEVLLDGESPVLVSVHVRRTNMLREKNVYQPGPSYFKKAMGLYRNKYGARVVFVVVTDDVGWCKHNIQGADVCFSADTGSKNREDDFAIAVSCNHTVLSVGTFGWWIGFVTGGEVVYIQNWVLGNWKQHYIPHQFFPHSWMGLTV